MSNLSIQEIAKTYASLMGHVKFRLEILRSSIDSAENVKQHEHSVITAEIAYLQVRKICETLALSTLCAHNQLPETNSNKFVKNYNAEAIFGMLSKVNDNGFPLAVRPINGGEKQFSIITEGMMTRSDLKKIYNQCHLILHNGNLADLIAGKEIVLDFRELVKIHNQFAELLKIHMVPLPEFENVLICILHQKETGKAHVRIAAAQPLKGDAKGAARWVTKPETDH